MSIFSKDVEHDAQKNAHCIVLKSMEYLQFLHYQHSNQSSGGIGYNNKDIRLVDIRKRAKELVTFVGLVRMNGSNGSEDVFGKISRMEALIFG